MAAADSPDFARLRLCIVLNELSAMRQTPIKGSLIANNIPTLNYYERKALSSAARLFPKCSREVPNMEVSKALAKLIAICKADPIMSDLMKDSISEFERWIAINFRQWRRATPPQQKSMKDNIALALEQVRNRKTEPESLPVDDLDLGQIAT